MQREALDRGWATFRESAFRMETLPTYAVPEEDEAWQAFVHGRPLPHRSPETSPWLREIAAYTAAGRRLHRVHVVDRPLSPYMRFELAGYEGNAAAGEEIYLVERGAHPDFATFRHDWWLFDENYLVLRTGASGHRYRRVSPSPRLGVAERGAAGGLYRRNGMTPEEFEAAFDRFTRSAFRLETLPAYLVGGDEAERIEAWRMGRPRPIRSVRTSPWLRRIALTTAAGPTLGAAARHRRPLPEYLRYQLVGYVESAAVGEEIRLIERTAFADPLRETGKSYVLDHIVTLEGGWTPRDTPTRKRGGPRSTPANDIGVRTRHGASDGEPTRPRPGRRVQAPPACRPVEPGHSRGGRARVQPHHLHLPCLGARSTAAVGLRARAGQRQDQRLSLSAATARLPLPRHQPSEDHQDSRLN